MNKVWFSEMYSLSADLLSQGAVAAFAVAAADLHHHHDEHGHVEQEHQAEVTHTGGVEDALVLDPTAERKHEQQKEELLRNWLLMSFPTLVIGCHSDLLLSPRATGCP